MSANHYDFFEPDELASADSRFFRYTRIERDGQSPVLLQWASDEILFVHESDDGEMGLFALSLRSGNAETVRRAFTHSLPDELQHGFFERHNPYFAYFDNCPSENQSATIGHVLLDFLFDLQQNDRFRSVSGLREKVEVLGADFLMGSLMRRCLYFFQRENFQKAAADLAFSEGLGNLERVRAEKLWVAEQDWLAMIMSPQATQFHASGGWFGHADGELNAVLFDDPVRALVGESAPILPGMIWNFHPYPYKLKCWARSFLNKTARPERPAKKFERFRWLRLLLFTYQKAGPSAVSNQRTAYFKFQIEEGRDKVIAFLLHRFSFFRAYRFFNFAHPLFSVILIGAYLLVLWVVLGLFETGGFWTGVRFFAVFTVGYCALFLPAFLISLFMLSSQYIRLFGRIKTRLPLHFHQGLAMPGMVMAIIASWLGFIPLSEEAWMLNLNIDDFYFAMILFVLFIFALVLTYHAVHRAVPFIRARRAVLTSLGIIVVSISFSLGIGIVCMDAGRENIFSEPAKFLPKERGSVRVERFTALMDSFEHRSMAHLEADWESRSCHVMEDWVRFRHEQFARLSEKTESDFCDALQIDPQMPQPELDKWHAKMEVALAGDMKANRVKRDSLIRLLIDGAHHSECRVLWVVPMPHFSYWQFRRLFLCNNGQDRYVYLFPRLLFIHAFIAFFIGFIVELAIKSKSGKESPV